MTGNAGISVTKSTYTENELTSSFILLTEKFPPSYYYTAVQITCCSNRIYNITISSAKNSSPTGCQTKQQKKSS